MAVVQGVHGGNDMQNFDQQRSAISGMTVTVCLAQAAAAQALRGDEMYPRLRHALVAVAQNLQAVEVELELGDNGGWAPEGQSGEAFEIAIMLRFIHQIRPEGVELKTQLVTELMGSIAALPASQTLKAEDFELLDHFLNQYIRHLEGL